MRSNDKYEKRIHQLEIALSGYLAAVTELKVLNEIAVEAGSTVNVDQTLNLIVQKTIKLLNAEQGIIYLVTEQKDIFKTLIKQENISVLKSSYNVGTDFIGWVLANGKTLLIEDLSIDNQFISTDEEKKEIHSVLCAPIWFGGRITGVIQILNKKNSTSFTSDELTLLSIIAIQAGQLIKNSQLQQEAMIKMKEAEIAKLKSRFFTNISHEFKTPLTIILGRCDQLLSELTGDKFHKKLDSIKQNSIRLLDLINQLLDLSKLESGKLILKTSCGNIVSFVTGLAFSFESLAEQKDIKLTISSEKENIELYFDKDKMLKILSNLLSNALKFTGSDGEIKILIKEIEKADKVKFVEIKVRDKGIGISDDELPKLFDRFYQVDSSMTREHGGSGIGLALTKELVELHRGDIRVTSVLGEGSEFTIEFPLGKKHLNEDEIIKAEAYADEDPLLSRKIQDQMKIIESDSSLFSEKINIEDPEYESFNELIDDDKVLVLIVEDNVDVRDFIKDSLGDEIAVIEASNGEQGIRKAEKLIPDLIISDVLMPKMDGNELTRILKNDEKTSHIPIILLTAKSGQESKLEGLETGADDYLTKPFDPKELQVRIKNLINIRRKLQEKFSDRDFITNMRGKEKKLTNLEEKFIAKVLEVIDNHIAEEDFSIEQFGKEVGMSRVQLHRKLKALSGKSASLYIRSVRLSKAKKLIEEQKGNVSEIAYSVGFSSPEYFTRCFKKEYGVPPSDLLN